MYACLPDVSRKRELRGSRTWSQEMALVAQARRALLLRTHRHRLCKEDLEDCFSQATLELLAKAREGRRRWGLVPEPARTWRTCSSSASSRASTTIAARCGGRSPALAALAHARRLGDGADGFEVADVRAEIERIVTLRTDLRSLGQVIQRS